MILPKKVSEHRFGFWLQWYAAIEIFMMGVMVGIVCSWASPYLAKLSRPDSPLPITDDEAAWFASLINISRPLGAVLGAIFVSTFGTKISTLLIGIPFALGWACFFIVNSVSLIYISRLLSGIGIGWYYSAFPLYIGEISDPKIRGALVSFIMQGILVGTTLGSVMGAYLDIWLFAAISFVPNVIYVITFLIMPQTPYYLVSQHRNEEAARSIQLYNRNADVTTELSNLEKFMATDRQMTFLETLRELNTPINRKTLLMIGTVYAFLQLSGLFTVTAYLETMLIRARVTVITPSFLVIMVNISGVVGSWVAIYTNDKFGRTIMLAISCGGVAIAMTLWGINYCLLDLGYDNPNFQWLSIAASFIYQITLAVGLMPVPTTLTSEMFAPKIKSIAACIINITSGIFAFSASRSYHPMVEYLTEKFVFWIYALLMIITAVYTLTCIPETKGKSLAEIQELLAKRKNSIKKIAVDPKTSLDKV
ncbi:hypothetical protein PV325_012043 [Microctonus aethiopoides]|uniref:Major facilitator superfamily (MFS) profile domain-containing protein n=1 Tax=Microctonus aethiopoides TaxID=144406 RepID=A0AA39F746_9HYME|nr:hypothetical protein PV325_012043 [Microctonus aethiopoides]KAK0164193.1 hypothetical protein PV328_002849 [Microctonus aethiopoides]